MKQEQKEQKRKEHKYYKCKSVDGSFVFYREDEYNARRMIIHWYKNDKLLGPRNPLQFDEFKAIARFPDEKHNIRSRSLIKKIRGEGKIPLVANRNGFFIAASRKDILDYEEKLHKYIGGLEHNLDLIQKYKKKGKVKRVIGQRARAVLNGTIVKKEERKKNNDES